MKQAKNKKWLQNEININTVVKSTFAGSPIIVPLICLYPAYLISCEFHTRNSFMSLVLCGNIDIVDLNLKK